jgi:hypothetical protein
MTVQITKKITGFKVKTETNTPVAEKPEIALETIHEGLKRPDVLHGATYSIKHPDKDRCLSVTINDMVLNEGTEHEQKRPYEVFIQSHSADDAQWVMALTRISSALFRKGGDVKFIADELKSVNDPTQAGNYVVRGKGFMPSLVSHIGEIMDNHFEQIGVK